MAKESATVRTVSRAEAKCRQLSPEHKTELFNKYIVPNFASVKSLTRQYTDHYQDVDENYNYVLAQLYNYIGSYDPKKSLDTWIHICTKRACFHQNKKRAEEASHYTDIEMCTPDDIYQHGTNMIEYSSLSSLADNVSGPVYAALMQIPPHRLSPFLMYAQGYGIREITASEFKLGHLEKKSEDVVKSRIFWARKELQYILKQHGITKDNHKGKGHD